MINETFENYLHNFSLWTACRAIQRGFVKTEVIIDFIESSRLQYLIKEVSRTPLTEKTFDAWHKKTVNRIISKAGKKGIDISYGRAAKLVAIYLKTSLVIPGPTTSLAKFAHPPVDRKLLEALKMEHKTLCSHLSGNAWTLYGKDDYFQTIRVLRKICSMERLPYFWMIEKYWTL
jgi:hypothetical protein